MVFPIPANDIKPLIAGDKVRIVLQFQDPGDDEFDRIVIEAPEGCNRMLVEARIPNFNTYPTERIVAGMLERV